MTDKIYSLTHDEGLLDSALKILSQAIPEMQTDAMTDYAKALRFLYAVKDPRIQPVIDALENVYIYPERKEHNSAIRDLHDFRETLHEEKLSEKLEGLGANSLGLGERDKPKRMLWFALILVAALLLSKTLK